MKLQGVENGDLAKRIGKSASAVSRYRTGESDPGVDGILTIAAALDVPPSLLLEEPTDRFYAGRRSVIGAVRRYLSEMEAQPPEKRRRPSSKKLSPEPKRDEAVGNED